MSSDVLVKSDVLFAICVDTVGSMKPIKPILLEPLRSKVAAWPQSAFINHEKNCHQDCSNNNNQQFINKMATRYICEAEKRLQSYIS